MKSNLYRAYYNYSTVNYSDNYFEQNLCPTSSATISAISIQVYNYSIHGNVSFGIKDNNHVIISSATSDIIGSIWTSNVYTISVPNINLAAYSTYYIFGNVIDIGSKGISYDVTSGQLWYQITGVNLEGSLTAFFVSKSFAASNWKSWGNFSANDTQQMSSTINYYAVTATSTYNLCTNSLVSLTKGDVLYSDVGPYIQIISSLTRTDASVIPMIDSFTITWINVYPTISYTNETHYSNSIVYPVIGEINTTFYFRVKYADNDPPASGYPKLNILKGGTTIYSLSMSSASDDYSEGVICSTSTLLAPCSWYSYTITAADSYNLFSTAAICGAGPDVKVSLSGYVRDPWNNPMGSVTVTLSGDASGNYITSSNGYYEFLNLTAGNNYSIAPSSYAYYSFTPSARSYSLQNSPFANQDFTLIDSSPTLEWTGEADYTNKAVDLTSGSNSTIYNFRIKYKDVENNSPTAGFPKVCILKGGTTVQTISMNPEGGADYISGVIYSTGALLSPCSYYSYNFQALDCWGLLSTTTVNGAGPDAGFKISGYVYYPDGGTPFPNATVRAVGPTTRTCVTDGSGHYELICTYANDWALSASSSSSAGLILFTPASKLYADLNGDQSINFTSNGGNPVLGWTGEQWYTTGGIYPALSLSSSTYVYRVKYTDSENDGPALGYPKVHIKKNDAEISGSPFVMAEADASDADYTDGKLYYCDAALSPGNNYSYFFEAKDRLGATATGAPANSSSGPDVQACISGKITSYFGEPIVNNKINLYSSSTSTCFTDSNGVFLFTFLETSAVYTVFPASSTACYFDNPYITENPLTADVTVQFLKMSDEKMVSGNITDPRGAGISGIQATLSGTHSGAYWSETNGNFHFYITTETYSVSLTHPTYLFSPSSYTLSGIAADTGGLNFFRLNRAPSFNCTGEAGYVSGAAEPAVAAVNQNITFRIKYSDPDNDPPKMNYPMVYILKEGSTVQTLGLSYLLGSYNSGAIYSGTTPINKAGNYSYNIIGYDSFDMSQNGIFTGSFQVSAPIPGVPQSTPQGIKDGASVVSGQVYLCWSCENTNNDELTYTLYLSNPQNSQSPASILKNGKSNSSLNAVYTGKNTSYTINSLEANKVFVWKVRAENQYGAVSESPEYSFSTIAQPAKAFNYPNPFNPARNESTNIVFTMAEDGFAEVSVYSEYGNMCRRMAFDNLHKGTNQVAYDGKDDCGQIMYNGTYPCIIDKKYQNKEEKDKCRLLIIK